MLALGQLCVRGSSDSLEGGARPVGKCVDGRTGRWRSVWAGIRVRGQAGGDGWGQKPTDSADFQNPTDFTLTRKSECMASETRCKTRQAVVSQQRTPPDKLR